MFDNFVGDRPFLSSNIVSVYPPLKVLKVRADLPKCCLAAIVSGLKKQKVQTTTLCSLAGLQESVTIKVEQVPNGNDISRDDGFG